jgi:alkylation response protein AidB-like acyl-CoA dehydrogenase
MDLDFSEEQVMLRDTVKGVCEQYTPSSVVRLMETDDKGFPADFWQQLAELGIAGVGLPESAGGMGWGSLEMAIVYEEFGRALAPSPHFTSCVLSAAVLQQAGSEAMQEQWLPQLATGEAIIVPAWHEVGSGFEQEGVQLAAEKTADGFSLSGTKLLVPFASSASRLLVLARCDNDVIGLLVDPAADGVSLQKEKNHAGENLYQVSFDKVEVAGDQAMINDFWTAWEQAMTDSLIPLAAQAVGGAEAIHDMANEYAKQREQFGKPIGAFMAIAHYLADLIVKIEGAKVLVYQAAWARDNGKPYHKLAAMAKLQACNVFREAAAQGVQIHGGYGFTEEGAPQLFFRRAKQQQVMFWDSAYLEKKIAAAVLDDAAA